MGYSITRHAMERYSERIMDKDNKTDVASFIATHNEKINEDINKMVEYGELLFEGKSTNGDYNKNTVQIYLNDLWVIIIDPKSRNVVTLFKIDLGLGDEFNKDYVKRLYEKLNIAKEKQNTELEKIKEREKEYNDIIKDNTNTINEYKRIIKSLEEQNENYKNLVQEMTINKDIAEKEIRQVIGTLTSKKIF